MPITGGPDGKRVALSQRPVISMSNSATHLPLSERAADTAPALSSRMDHYEEQSNMHAQILFSCL